MPGCVFYRYLLAYERSEQDRLKDNFTVQAFGYWLGSGVEKSFHSMCEDLGLVERVETSKNEYKKIAENAIKRAELIKKADQGTK